MGSQKSRGWWPIALFTLVFVFGIVTVATLAWLGKGRGWNRLAGASTAREDGANQPLTHTFDELHEPDELDVYREAPIRSDDPRLESLRQAADFWRRSAGPRRRVIDQVCLVSDVPAFLEAIAMWDERHFFPILIDEPAWTLPFLRAFRPARVVRYNGRGQRPTELDQDPWREAILAVSRAWAGSGRADADLPPGGGPPHWLGPTPPGMVLASPDGPMLAGAVALAAGRFQPLVRLEPDAWPLNDRNVPGRPRHFGDVLTLNEAWHFAKGVEARIKPLVAHYDELGDDCDFLTLAGECRIGLVMTPGRI